MAERRMFSIAVVNSARFLRLPASSQLLYFHLGMRADDDGIAEAFSVMRTVGAAEDDLRILIARNFVRLLNDDLVVLITDWNKNNQIRKDRYRPSIYHDLISGNHTGQPIDNQLATTWQPTDNQPTTNRQPVDDQLATTWLSTGQPSIEKYNLVESNLDKYNSNTPIRSIAARSYSDESSAPSEISATESGMNEPFEPVEPKRETKRETRETKRETNEPAVFNMPLAGGKEWPITQAMVDEYAELYPNVDIMQSLRNMRGWCLSNPTRMKTVRGVRRFINSWLTRDQDSGRCKRSAHDKPSNAPLEEWEREWLDEYNAIARGEVGSNADGTRIEDSS